MRIVVAGASGFIGHALVRALRAAGHEVKRLVRRSEGATDEIGWNPTTHEIAASALEGVDAVVNLAGENIAAGRWTAARRERVLRSRVNATSTLIAAMSNLQRCPRVLINGSATGFYGNRGEDILTETSSIGHGFLPEVCWAWETHAECAQSLGIRPVLLRFGVVLAPDGGALAKMLPVFRAGLGGRLGSGRQWMSWVTRDDVIDVIQQSLADERYFGPVNVVAPNPVTNTEFTAVLARAIHRPSVLPVPTWALRIAFGQMADEALLASTRAVPAKLQNLGYTFQHPTIEDAFQAMF